MDSRKRNLQFVAVIIFCGIYTLLLETIFKKKGLYPIGGGLLLIILGIWGLVTKGLYLKVFCLEEWRRGINIALIVLGVVFIGYGLFEILL